MSIVREFTVSNNSYSLPTVCPVCRSGNPFLPSLATDLFRLLECPACGLGFLFPQPPKKHLEELYDERYYGTNRKKFIAAAEIAIAALTWLKWKRLQPLLQPGGRLLDIGCGRGTLLKLARAAGLEAYGTERPSPLGHPLPYVSHKELAECGFPDNHFQLVVLWHVLEHLPDPQATLREIGRVLKPGGWLSLAVPNFGGAQAQASGGHWFHLDLPRHFWHFRLASLRMLLESSGFQLVRCGTWSLEYDWFGTLQSWMNRAFRDENRLYALLKREPAQARAKPLRRLALASLLALPALASSLWDAARGHGGTLTVMAQKTVSGREGD